MTDDLRIEQNINSALKMLESYAPTDTAALDIVYDYYSELRTYEKDTTAVLRSIIGTIYDGLAYGNWPWIETFRKDRKINRLKRTMKSIGIDAETAQQLLDNANKGKC